MARRYLEAGQPICTGASRAGQHRRGELAGQAREVTAGQPTVITPYANVDMTALVHQGLTVDLAPPTAPATRWRAACCTERRADSPGRPADRGPIRAHHPRRPLARRYGRAEQPRDAAPVDAATVFEPDDAVASLRVAGCP